MTARAEIIQITPEIASTMLETMSYAGQRRIPDDQVDTYALMMRKGDFGISDMAIRVLDGRPYLLNGYQRLYAVIRSGVPIFINMTTDEVENESELAQHYGRFDQQRRRQFREIVAGYNLEEQFGLSVNLQDKVATCAILLVPGFQGTSQDKYLRTNDLRIRFLWDWANIAREALSAINYPMGQRNERAVTRLLTVPFLSTILATYKYQPVMAATFWRRIVEDDRLRAKAPEKAVRKMLAETRARGMLDYQPVTRRISHAWNAHMEGRDLSILVNDARRVGDKTYYPPIKLLGTPYNGKGVIRLFGYQDPKITPLPENLDEISAAI